MAVLLYLAAPVVEAVYYYTQQKRGAYLPGADTIAIPIIQFAGALLLISPVFAVAVWLAARTYQGQRSLLAFDKARPVHSLLWSLLLGGLALYCLGEALFSLCHSQPLDFAEAALWAYLLLCVRSSHAGGGRVEAQTK